jgi:hypothetical protein
MPRYLPAGDEPATPEYGRSLEEAESLEMSPPLSVFLEVKFEDINDLEAPI